MGLRAFTFCGHLVRRFGWLLLLLTAGAGFAAEPKRVLVVHSFGSAAPPFTTASTAFESTLAREMGEPVDLDEVSLDVARYATLDIEEALVDLMRRRQTKWQPDLVVPIGSPACIFVAQYRDRLFPATTPIIYTGMDQRRLPPGTLQQNATFVGSSYDLPGAVEDILEVAPDTTNVVVVIGASPLEQFWVNVLQLEYERFTNRVGFTWFNELSFDQMLDRSAKLPPHSFMLLILLMRDASGVTHNADEALRRIHEVANAPVNGLFNNQLGMGIVGGRLYADEIEGQESALIAARILHGEAATNFPPKIIKPQTPRYDWRELQRWNISTARLPPGSTILFREPTTWEQYKWRIVAGAALVLVEAALIVVLVANLVIRRRAERSLAETEIRFRVAADAAPVMIWMSGQDKLYTFFNKPWLEFTGRTIDQEMGNGWAEGVHRDDLERCLKSRVEAFEARQPFVIEYRLRRYDGQYRWISDTGAPRHNVRGGFSGYIGSCLDITERRQVEQTARDLSGRLIQAQEAERARLARELHDDITQRLARLAIDAGRLETEGGAMRQSGTWCEIRDGLVKLSEDVHSLSYKLHPALLEDLGLADALKAECERFRRQQAISVEVMLEAIPAKIPSDTGLCLFRVTQEALRNVARHAGASQATVSLRSLDGGLQLAVGDNGRGFDPALKREHRSLGLASMRERIRLLSGELDIESSPDNGTTVVAWVPLKELEV